MVCIYFVYIVLYSIYSTSSVSVHVNGKVSLKAIVPGNVLRSGPVPGREAAEEDIEICSGNLICPEDVHMFLSHHIRLVLDSLQYLKSRFTSLLNDGIILPGLNGTNEYYVPNFEAPVSESLADLETTTNESVVAPKPEQRLMRSDMSYQMVSIIFKEYKHRIKPVAGILVSIYLNKPEQHRAYKEFLRLARRIYSNAVEKYVNFYFNTHEEMQETPNGYPHRGSWITQNLHAVVSNETKRLQNTQLQYICDEMAICSDEHAFTDFLDSFLYGLLNLDEQKFSEFVHSFFNGLEKTKFYANLNEKSREPTKRLIAKLMTPNNKEAKEYVQSIYDVLVNKNHSPDEVAEVSDFHNILSELNNLFDETQLPFLNILNDKFAEFDYSTHYNVDALVRAGFEYFENNFYAYPASSTSALSSSMRELFDKTINKLELPELALRSSNSHPTKLLNSVSFNLNLSNLPNK